MSLSAGGTQDIGASSQIGEHATLLSVLYSTGHSLSMLLLLYNIASLAAQSSYNHIGHNTVVHAIRVAEVFLPLRLSQTRHSPHVERLGLVSSDWASFDGPSHLSENGQITLEWDWSVRQSRSLCSGLIE
ncbi:hypothetical protein Pst134EB_004537 [Puccinia striiformis f. sp. tritici]|nr:hypothetical protein Pst134EB_004537 [Puccinia striiformis f. sp. tritici]